MNFLPKSFGRALALSLALLLFSSSGSRADGGPLRLSSTHGVVMDEKGNPLTLTGPLVLRAQAGVLQDIRAKLDKAGQAQLDADMAMLKEKSGGTEASLVAGNAALIASRYSKLKGGDLATAFARNRQLLSRYGTLIGKPFDPPMVEKGNLPGWLDIPNIPPLREINWKDIIFKPPFFLYNYTDRCEAAGVSVPPPLNPESPSGGWVNAGDQKISYLVPPGTLNANHFNNKLSRMYYWYGAAKNTFCVANPIINVNSSVADPNHADTTPNTYNAFGVICQSAVANKKSRACYWDNATDAMPRNVAYDVRDTVNFFAPPHLPDDNRCTDCHAGGHSFIVMPDIGISAASLKPSAIDKALTDFEALNPAANFHSIDTWFKPLVDAPWPQNVRSAFSAATGDPNALSCGGCHGAAQIAKELPNVTGPTLPRDRLPKFCNFILKNFLTKQPANANFYEGAMASQAHSMGAPKNGMVAYYKACKALNRRGPFPATPDAWAVHTDPP